MLYSSFRARGDLFEHGEHDHVYATGGDFNDVPTNVPYFTVGLARTLPGGRAFREGELPGVSPTNFAIDELVEVEKLTPKVN